MPKKQYEKPELEVTVFVTEDILTTSSENFDDNQGEWDPLSPWEIF